VRELLPQTSADVGDLAATLRADERMAPGRPWVLANMVSTLDGAASLDGRSGGIGGDGDRALFAAVRSLADLIVVGAGTARAERYGPAASGARIAVVTSSLDLPDDLPLFEAARQGRAHPIVICPASSPQERRDHLAGFAEVVTVDGDGVAPADIVAAATVAGARVVLCEGGPSLLAQFVAADLIDEWFVTIGPMVASGTAPRILTGSGQDLRGVALSRVWEQDGTLFLRYLRP